MKQPKRFETRAVHSGERRVNQDGNQVSFYPISTPIYASTTFSHPNIETTDRVLGGEEQGYSYARYDNPTVRAFEEALASLEAPEAEAGVRAFAFASGMAATHAALAAVELMGGGTVLAADQLYGSTATLLVQVFGAVVAGPPYAAAVEQLRKLVGGVLGPFEAWLAHRGLKTLPLRMGRQCENARQIASSLAAHPKVAKVNHPSLRTHPDHQTAERVLSDTGGLVSFELAAEGREAAYAFLNALELCVKAPSLGDIYTLAIHPATSSHRELSPSRRERLGVGENLVRLSVGIEHAGDVISDLEQAFEQL